MVTVSAPGKLMVMGEHSVLYGQPCIVTAVSSRLTIEAQKTETGKTEIIAPQSKDTRFVDSAIKHFFSMYPDSKNVGVTLTTRSDFDNTLGFGSSSAVTVATIKALNILFETPLSDKKLFDLSYQIVLNVQGSGSGFDVAAAVFGGTLLFRKGGTEITQLFSEAPLVVGYTGIKANTVNLMQMVASKQKKYPGKVGRIMEAIGKLVMQAKPAIEKKDWERLGTLMNFNQEHLRDLGVSTQKLEDLISAAKSAGALGAKLSGAGGGDCMIALATSDKRQAISKAIEEAGGQIIDVTTNAQGVRIEEIIRL